MAQNDLDELPRKRWWLRPLIGCVALALLALAAQRGYRHLEPARLAKQGQEFLRRGDTMNALLSAQRALQIDPLNDPAARLMIALTERLKSPSAVGWREQVATLNPNSTTDALAWAATALQFAQRGAAQQALDTVPQADRASAEYHEKAGLVALQAGKSSAAGAHFTQAAQLEPANELHRYNLAAWQVRSSDPEQRRAGAESLARLAKSDRLRAHALRSLVTQLGHEGRLDEALARNADLVRDPGVEFRDRLVQLALLRGTRAPQFDTVLAETQETAAGGAEHSAMLLHWMRMNQLAAGALAWAQQLPASVAAQGPVAAAHAEILGATGAWEDLKTLTAQGNWGTREYLRHAWEARARRELHDGPVSSAAWQAALAAAMRRRDDLLQLSALAAKWGWIDEMRDVLWVAADAPAPRGALQLLHRSYVATGDTDGLLRVATRALEVDPGSEPARNNVAMFSLLRRVDLDKALETARLLHTKAPRNPAYASTLALALHLRDRSAEGLEILRKLPEAELELPSIAIYYSVLLAASGAAEQAGRYRELARNGPLLPEENALLDQVVKAAH